MWESIKYQELSIREWGHMQETPEKIRSFTGLRAWEEAHKLVIMIYTTTKKFPKEELLGLTSQVRRASVSISSNIAEGFSRNFPKEKRMFYSHALASLTEVQNQLLIARDIQYLSEAEFKTLADQTILTSKLLNGLKKKTLLLNS